MVLEDVRGQTLPAIDVFALSIQALKDHLERSIKMKNISLDNERTKWVLTVPAMWTDRAKQFMRESTELVCTHKTRIFIKHLCLFCNQVYKNGVGVVIAHVYLFL